MARQPERLAPLPPAMLGASLARHNRAAGIAPSPDLGRSEVLPPARDLLLRDSQVRPPQTPSRNRHTYGTIFLGNRYGLLQASRSPEAEGAMSGMAIKFTSLAQIEANQFVSGDDRLCLGEAEDCKAGVPRLRRSAGGAVSAPALIPYRIYQLDTGGHVLAGHSIVCRSDAEAMDAACRFAKQAATIEVWESARRVSSQPRQPSGRVPAPRGLLSGRWWM